MCHTILLRRCPLQERQIGVYYLFSITHGNNPSFVQQHRPLAQFLHSVQGVGDENYGLALSFELVHLVPALFPEGFIAHGEDFG